MTKIVTIVTKDEFRFRKQEGDGICANCMLWSMGNADPQATNVFCSDCENRSVHGVVAAEKAGIIEVK